MRNNAGLFESFLETRIMKTTFRYLCKCFTLQQILTNKSVIFSCLFSFIAFLFSGCLSKERVHPAVVTEPVNADSDDPAIWIDSANIEKSLVIGTDKYSDGGLYVFDLHGKIIKHIEGLKRPNNVDVGYGMLLSGKQVDIAAATERERNQLRVFSLPGMEAVDGGGLPVFEGEKDRIPMGIAFYKQPVSGVLYVIVGRKSGPSDGYLWQYQLLDSSGQVQLKLIRKFGRFSGRQEIESIAVDNELGYVYYSDERYGIRKYFADPEKGNEELAAFGQNDFLKDCEGISLYKLDKRTGYILVSDQSAGQFHVYPREGAKNNPNAHSKIATISMSTKNSDGSDIVSQSLPGFPGGLFVAMSEDKTFQFYRWNDMAEKYALRSTSDVYSKQ